MLQIEHELRNVFTAIVSNIELAQLAVGEPEVRRRLSLIDMSARSGLEVLERMRRLLEAQAPH